MNIALCKSKISFHWILQYSGRRGGGFKFTFCKYNNHNWTENAHLVFSLQIAFCTVKFSSLCWISFIPLPLSFIYTSFIFYLFILPLPFIHTSFTFYSYFLTILFILPQSFIHTSSIFYSYFLYLLFILPSFIHTSSIFYSSQVTILRKIRGNS